MSRAKYMRFLVLIAAAILCSVALVAQAQEQNPAPMGGPPRGQMGRGGPRGPMSPQMELERLNKQLNLTQDQQDKLKPILEDRQKQMEALRNDTAMSREDRMTKMRDIRKNTDDQIRQALNPDQQKKFDEMQQQMMRGGPGGRRGGPPSGGQGAPPPPGI
jgi:protein CpxP